MLHLRVVSPPDVTGAVMPMLRSEPGVINLTVLPGAVSHPDGDAVHFDVLHGAANDVIGQLRGLGLDQRGAIVLENVDTSICGLADQAAARRGRHQEFTPVWAEVEGRITLEGIGRRRVAGLRQRQRGLGLVPPAPSQRRGPDRRRGRRGPRTAGRLAACRPPHGGAIRPAENRRVMA